MLLKATTKRKQENRLQSRKTAGKAEDEIEGGLINGKCGLRTEQYLWLPWESSRLQANHTNTPLIFVRLPASITFNLRLCCICPSLRAAAMFNCHQTVISGEQKHGV